MIDSVVIFNKVFNEKGLAEGSRVVGYNDIQLLRKKFKSYPGETRVSLAKRMGLRHETVDAFERHNSDHSLKSVMKYLKSYGFVNIQLIFIPSKSTKKKITKEVIMDWIEPGIEGVQPPISLLPLYRKCLGKTVRAFSEEIGFSSAPRLSRVEGDFRRIKSFDDYFLYGSIRMKQLISYCEGVGINLVFYCEYR